MRNFEKYAWQKNSDSIQPQLAQTVSKQFTQVKKQQKPYVWEEYHLLRSSVTAPILTCVTYPHLPALAGKVIIY
jgi:hypothetical protein